MALGSGHRLLCGSVFLWAVYGMVPEPRNLKVHSVMLESVLQWDLPIFHKENVTYRVQHRKEYDGIFTDLCESTEVTEYNISNIPIYVPSILRVRTEFQNNQSNWVFTTFTPIADTKISPPAIQVEASQAGTLSVQLTGPYFIRNGGRTSLNDFYGPVIYRIHIWKKGYSGKEVRRVNTSVTFDIIPDLDPGTTYCLKAQAFIEQFNKNGEWSESVCVQTNETGINLMLLFLIVPLGLVLLFICCYMIFRIYLKIKYVFFPSFSLPQHFKEFLDKPSYSSYFVPSQIQGEDYTYEKITVLSEEK